MFSYTICNQPDSDLFKKQCRALEKNIDGLQAHDLMIDVDGSLVQEYSHPNGRIQVRNDMQVGALYVDSQFDLIPYFKKH